MQPEQIPHLSDNLHVHPDSGAIFIATFPRALELMAHFGAGGAHKSPTEVYQITNDTSADQLWVAFPCLSVSAGKLTIFDRAMQLRQQVQSRSRLW